MSLLTCRKIAVLKFTVFVLHEEKPKGVGAHFTPSEKASSVPGRMHTAVVESSGAANPRVPVLKLTVLSLSPTLAGRDLTWWRLKSHMDRGTPQTSRSPRPFLLAEPAQNSNRARHFEPLRGGTSQPTYRGSNPLRPFHLKGSPPRSAPRRDPQCS